MRPTYSLAQIIIFLGCVASLVFAPYSGARSLTFFFLLVEYIILAQSFNLVAGYVGYISFGHVAFFGIGGYIAAILTWKMGLASYYFFFPLIFGGLGAGVAAYFLGIPLMKLRGAYFAIATIALNEALKVTIFNVPEDLAGGSFGIPVPMIRQPTLSYYSMVIFAAILVLTIYLITNSKHGVALKAIREDEDAAKVMGIDAARYKVRAFTLSAFFMGIAGGLDVCYIGYIYPEAAFNIETNVMVIVMTMLGGSGTVIGPLMGVVILYVIEDFVWAKSPFSHLIILGVILGGIVLFMRHGIIGALEERVPRLRGKFK
ncbi:MAG: branched-chain amino acid ABC transporter permease [Proteobacteria bacterium]|nr:branched-chain amino acid ABC transporter permease [Pseudomonadota bacterium]